MRYAACSQQPPGWSLGATFELQDCRIDPELREQPSRRRWWAVWGTNIYWLLSNSDCSSILWPQAEGHIQIECLGSCMSRAEPRRFSTEPTRSFPSVRYGCRSPAHTACTMIRSTTLTPGESIGVQKPITLGQGPTSISPITSCATAETKGRSQAASISSSVATVLTRPEADAVIV